MVASPRLQPQQQSKSNIGRKKKRPRDPTENDDEDPSISIAKKKARIAIEIISQPLAKPQPKIRPLIVSSSSSSSSSGTADEPPAQQPAAPSPSSPPKQKETVTAAAATQTEAAAPPAPPPPKPKPKNHHEKTVNGIRHELDRLQPNAADLKAKDEKRKLRSQESTRFKSELSAYFPEYDEVIGNEQKEEHILDLDTPIIIYDSAKSSKHLPLRRQNEYSLKEFPDSLFTSLHAAQRVDFSWLDKNYKEDGGEDPLHDAYFESMHRRPERQEKTIRNTDKCRAQHEKDQVIRILESLQGHDWLKLMGVSGVTESKKKEYEPARDYFIKGCETILEKFRIWREEEKRLKLEKEAAMAEAEEAAAEEEKEEAKQEDGTMSDGDPPDYSDIDASAARQLHEEAVARSAPVVRHSERRAKVELIPQGVGEVDREFKSFYKNPHLREAAMGKHRRSGRSAIAWGAAIPEFPEADFVLPEQYRDEETLKAAARRKRRDKRVNKS
ncbi:uncharacterized protein L3040_007625 [Drepanopeziza brunnea f. sp. 'multigermtubi']|uniref:uncharacterized protein n=1 Tax=Drepanopeziza brunnea f. sp. 'multigermtubi' TaxID=698441 RepID=UPI00238E76CC|nr:hypothetical protein L3040_007625 [Drepanopeziza brunnea f. sp. 'multigermtubi']